MTNPAAAITGDMMSLPMEAADSTAPAPRKWNRGSALIYRRR